MDKLIDFSAMAAAVDAACPRADRSKGGRPPYPTEALVRMVFLQGLYNLSDEQCEHQILDRLSFQRFCRLDGALHIPDARTLWAFRQRLAQGGLGGKAIFETLSQQLQQHGLIPRGGQIVDASIVQAPITQANAKEREALNRGVTDRRNRATDVRHIGATNRWVNGRPEGVTPGWILQPFGGWIWLHQRAVWAPGRTAHRGPGSRRCDAGGPGWRWRVADWPGRPDPTRGSPGCW